MKCSNCGAEVAEGMRFCGDCGAPVPQEKKCVSCGASIALKMKFCPECGAPQDGAAPKPKFNAAAFAMGDKNVISGDVIGHREETHISGNATIIKNEDQSKQVKRCHICGSLVLITDGFECPECGEFTCEKCFDADKNCCKDCAGAKSSSALDQYKQALQSALADGRIDLEERRNLNELAKKLGLTTAQAAKLEQEMKGEETDGFTAAENLELDFARKQFYACEGDVNSTLATAQKIFNAHPTSEKALSLYLPALAAAGKTDEALRAINAIGADVLSAYITQIDINLTKKDMPECERLLNKATLLWPESNVIKCYQAYYYLEMYHKYNDFNMLENATKANAALKDVKGELEVSHQIRVMSLLQNEAGEKPQVFDLNFCKENGLFFRIVANISTSGVYGGNAGNGSDLPPDEISLDVNGDDYEITFWAKQGTVIQNGKYTEYIALVFRPTYGDYWMLEPDGTESFYAVMKNYEDDDETDWKRLCDKYIRPYRVNGKQISSKQINFNEEILKMELVGIITCMADDPVPDEDGMEPFCFDRDAFS